MQGAGCANQAAEMPSEEKDEEARRIVVVDDDELSREVLTLIAMEAGFEVEAFESGEQALAALEAGRETNVILTDVQMPGLSGPALAEQFQKRMSVGTTLLAMSGSRPTDDKLRGYDGFLLKPFSPDELKACCDRRSTQPAADASSSAAMLNDSVFNNFSRSMSVEKTLGLYKMCLDDSSRRIAAMREALDSRDDPGYRRAAHAIKGGCGMVGAVELAKLAGEMETNGLPAEHDATPLEHFLAASARLGRMLDIKADGMRAEAPAVRP